VSGSPPLEFRLILDDPADGRWNMAVDHALLDSVERAGAQPVIRLYGFSPPTLSLGRFQRATEVVDVEAARRDGVTVVRRPTGGQAVLHDGELTYAVALSREHLEPFSKRAVYRFVAGALINALERLGLRVSSAGERRGDPANPDCFGTTGEYELADERGRKLVGSAQIVTRAAALQHGAIPINESNRRIVRYLRAAGPQAGHESGSLSALLGRDPGFAWVRAEVARLLGEQLRCRPSSLDDADKARAELRLAELYATDTWNLRP
jgi:lipoyl(octanoyl) transferase